MRRSVYVRIPNSIITKRKKILQLPQIPFTWFEFFWLFYKTSSQNSRENWSKSKLWKRCCKGQGSCWLWVMRSCCSIKGFFFIVCLLLIAMFQKRTEWDYSRPVCVHRAHSVQYDLLGQNGAHAGFRLLLKSETSGLRSSCSKRQCPSC